MAWEQHPNSTVERTGYFLSENSTGFRRWAETSDESIEATDRMTQGGFWSYPADSDKDKDGFTVPAGTSQRGQCQLPDLASFDLSKYEITQFRIAFTFDKSGYATKKELSLYLSENIDENYQLTKVTTVENAYNRETYVIYTDPSDLKKMTQAIKNGNTYITSYNGESAVGFTGSSTNSYTTNYCAMTSARILIYYKEKTCPFYYYNGTEFVRANNAYRYNGSTWDKIKSATLLA